MAEADGIIKQLASFSPEGILEDASTQAQALHLSKKLTASLQKPADAALELSFWPSYAFSARIAIALDLFNRIIAANGTATAETLAKESGAEELLIVRVLRALAAIGFVEEVATRKWQATSLTKAMTIPPIAAGRVHFWDQGAGTMVKMQDYFRENGYKCPTNPEDGAFQYAFGTKREAFNYWHQFPHVLDNFNTFMQGVRGSRPSWVEWFPVQERILSGLDKATDAVLLTDVGGGRGHDVEAFKKMFPNANGKLVLQDLPAVVDDIQTLDEGIVRDKYDFMTPQKVQGARVYFFHFIFHDWSDEVCLKILSNTVSAMKKGYSKILLNEFILPDEGCPLLPVGMDLNMMAMHAGQERTRSQWQGLLGKMGLEPTFWVPEGGGEGIVEAALT